MSDLKNYIDKRHKRDKEFDFQFDEGFDEFKIGSKFNLKVKGYPFEVLIKSKKINGTILSDQIKNLDWTMSEIDCRISFISIVTSRGV